MDAPRANPFPNYLQLRKRLPLPPWIWDVGRVLSVSVLVGFAVLLVARPDTGLVLFWKTVVPVLPLVFFLVPGLWRNLCPLAAANQLPRRVGISKAWNPPAWWKEYGYVLGFAAFFLLASSRKFLFNDDGTATSILILSALAAAFVGGFLLKGKSGWCSSICPVYPVQRLYNQSPAVLVGNTHCDPCVGCTKNCYDFNPSVAYLADLHEEDQYYVGYRRLFAYAMPGFVLGYFLVPNAPVAAPSEILGRMALFAGAGTGLFLAAESLVKLPLHRFTSLAAMGALNLFYLMGLPAWLATLGTWTGIDLPAAVRFGIQGALGGASLVWLVRTWDKEALYRLMTGKQTASQVSPTAAKILGDASRSASGAASGLEVRFEPSGKSFVAQAGKSILETAEAAGLPIESGCRMGMCGADPVVVLDGSANLSPMGEEEKATLARLGLGGNARLACMCKVRGSATISLDRSAADPSTPAEATPGDPSIRSVVVLGNGIAGVTAAENLRKGHPDCEIHLVAREAHPLYNRMGIAKLVYTRGAMEGLYLQPSAWYAERRITSWLNTRALRIDRAAKVVELATGESIPYDRLVLATGSSGLVPPIEGFGMKGTFVLREAEEAMALRAFLQEHGTRDVAVSGGGLLGLEAAYALRKIGQRVVVLERGEWLLRRQLDAAGGELLRVFLANLGIDVLVNAEAASVAGDDRVRRVVLKDGRVVPAEVLLAAVGIRPNVDLARHAGLETRRGVVVDARMRTSDPDIFACGDVGEFDGQIPGLWPVAVEQGRIAAANALGGEVSYAPSVPVTALKVVGLDVVSMGKISASGEGEEEILPPSSGDGRYRKLVLSEGRLVGAILMGHGESTSAVSALSRRKADLSKVREELKAGRWEVLDDLAETAG